MPLSQFFYFITNHFDIKLSYLFVFLILWTIVFISYEISNLISQRYGYIFLSLIITSLFYFYNYAADIEQIFFSAYILLFLIIFIEREKNYNSLDIKLDIISGLALGFTFLIRSSLILIPLFVLIYDIIDKKKSFSFKKSLSFILSSYILLLPWALLSKHFIDKFLLTEYNRANLNIITGALGITLTAEGDMSKLLDASNINPFIFAFKIISAEPLNYIMSFIRRISYFILSNIFIIIPSIYVIYKARTKKEIKILSLFVLSFVFIHCLFSVEKRYFLPASIVLSIISSSVFKIKFENSNASRLFIRNFFIFLLIPVLIMFYQIIKYPFSDKITVEKYISEHKNPNPDLYVIAALENLSYYNPDIAVLYLKEFLKNSRNSNLKQNIDELINIIENKSYKYPETSYPFNNHLIKALMLIKSQSTEYAKKYINERWEYISQSYLRSTTTSNEFYTDNEIRKYIKKTAYIYHSFPLIDSDIKKAENICLKLNNIISKSLYKDNFDCNLQSRIIAKKIGDYCKSKNEPDYAEIMEIISLEEKKEFEKARVKITMLMDKYPEYYKIYTEAGNIYILLNDFKKAKENFEKSIDLCPYAQDSYYGLSVVYSRLKMNKESTKLREKAKQYNIILN